MPKLRPKQVGKRVQAEFRDSPVRRCSPECPFFANGGSGCTYYAQNNVEFGEICLHDVAKMKEYADAFASGDTDVVKKDASQITASIVLSVQQMFHKILLEGATIDEPVRDAKGSVVWHPDPDWDPDSGHPQQSVVLMIKKEHPLISNVIKLCRGIGINLSEFKQTPKSADEKLAVAGHIVVENPEDIFKVMEDREKVEDKFFEGMKEGDKMLAEDPIYQKLLEQGDIIGENG
jgi:hypothetical protein